MIKKKEDRKQSIQISGQDWYVAKALDKCELNIAGHKTQLLVFGVRYMIQVINSG